MRLERLRFQLLTWFSPTDLASIPALTAYLEQAKV
ncbi:hypothetical protein Hypma_013155 [Hypsizygus marmoreus]|uniref:Uncharacterized protein n=1 Tax=Hypsizygus marmoreus TaxID=39966 RepID=A0A369JD21_HYPMA|nr:hypothetical protein Hypma_013155 [Hypsizygus marmoreus]